MKKRKTWQQLALCGVSSGVLPLTKGSVLSHLLKWGRLLTANRDAFKKNSQETDFLCNPLFLCRSKCASVCFRRTWIHRPKHLIHRFKFLYHLWYAVQWKLHRYLTLTLPLHFGSWGGLIRAQPWHEQQFIVGPTQKDKQNSRQFRIAN